MIGRTQQLQDRLGTELDRLVKECLSGSGSAKEAAWNRLLDEIRRMALDLGRRNYHLGLEDAEDMAQLVQIRVLERLPQLRQAAVVLLGVAALFVGLRRARGELLPGEAADHLLDLQLLVGQAEIQARYPFRSAAEMTSRWISEVPS